MKRVDDMIKYLSGDLTEEKSRAFEKELKENPELKEEFSGVELVFNLMGEELKQQDEENFREALDVAREKSGSKNSSKNKPLLRPWHLFMAIAASLAVILSIIGNRQGTAKIYHSCYNPTTDPVLMSLNEQLRGQSAYLELLMLWNEEDFSQCRKEASRHLDDEASDQLAILFFLLSSIETDQENEALERLYSVEVDSGMAVGQAIIWYKALAYVKMGNPSAAEVLLTTLTERSGSYQKDADKMKKKLKK